MIRRATLLAALALLAATAPAAAAPVGTPTELATGLDTPWGVADTGAGRVLVTELPGEVRVFESGVLQAGPVYTDAAAPAHKFLGIAVSPGYATNKFVYLYETRRTGTGVGQSRVTRLVDEGDALTNPTPIFTGIGSDLNHDGGRIAFGPDGFLYVTTGDIHDHARPRNIDNLNGKILRMTEAGAPAPGNPFNTDGVTSSRDYVYSYGHRHPQGLAWDGAGRLWETEHGPSGEGPAGAQFGRDELNLIKPGRDYGWPAVAGDQTCANIATEPPVIHSGPAPAWAPAGLAYAAIDGLLYAPALNGKHLHVFKPSGEMVTQHARLFEDDVRRRTAVVIDDKLWITTHTAPMSVLRADLAAGDGTIAWETYSPATAEPKTCSARTEGPQRGDETRDDTGTPPPATTTPTTPLATLPPVGDQLLRPAPRPADTLLRRARTALRALGLRGLLRRGSVATRVGGFAAGGRVTLRLQLRRANGGPLTVAQGRVLAKSRAPITVRARLTKRGRAVLKRRTKARLTFRVTYTPPDGARAVSRAVSATVARGGTR